MKKIISILLIVTFVFSMTLISVSAEAKSKFTREEAIALFNNANELFEVLNGKIPWLCDAYYPNPSKDYRPLVVDLDNYILLPPEPKRDYPDMNGYTFFRLSGIENGGKVYDVNGLSDIRVLIDKLFTNDVDCFEERLTEKNEERIPMVSRVIEDEDGNLYATLCHVIPIFFDINDYGKFKVNGDSATLNLDIRVLEDRYLGIFYFCNTSVEFKNTENGWKVSGGEYFDWYVASRYLGYPNFIDFAYKYSFTNDEDEREEVILRPATGDEYAYKIPALTVAALISVALPVSLLKKRRASA